MVLQMKDSVDFEAPIRDILREIEEHSSFSGKESSRELERLQQKLIKTREEIFGRLTRWQKALVARHPMRPNTLEYVGMIFDDFVEIHGDRRFADDPAIVGGFASFNGRPVAIVGHQKGRSTKQNIHRNFGMACPEGYRKAIRIMRLAEKFGRPIFTFIDTPGAYPGIGAEERGQAEAIAFNLREMAEIRVPIIVTVTGEGGSGGALGLGVGNVVNILDFAIYSVISPEGCAAILWSDQTKTQEAAENLRFTSSDLKDLGLVDTVIPEPAGGAHADPGLMGATLRHQLEQDLLRLDEMPPEDLVRSRYEKFRKMGAFLDMS
jgi:acetyl-CoA carboxylase carboxyl transferase subunit alpha